MRNQKNGITRIMQKEIRKLETIFFLKEKPKIIDPLPPPAQKSKQNVFKLIQPHPGNKSPA
jgi:hypothetical protein